MNRERRKALQEILDRLDDIRSDLYSIQEEEEEYRDNMPENLQGSERYEKADCAVSSLDDAYNAFDEIVYAIEEAME